jgi:hypothetical protein
LDEQTRTVLDAAADEVLEMAEHLIFVGERLHQLIEDGEAEAPQYGAGDDRRGEDPALVKKQMHQSLNRLVWSIEPRLAQPQPLKRARPAAS